MKANNTVLFDGDCSFCNFWVRFILKRDKKKQFSFLSLQSKEGIELREQKGISKDLDTLIFVNEKGKSFIKSSAALGIARRLPFPWFLGYIFIIIPPFIRHWLYDIIARNRHKIFKQKDRCEIPFDK